MAEQQQSERNVSELIATIERVGYEDRSLYYLDKTFKKVNTGTGGEEGAESAKPAEPRRSRTRADWS